MNFAVFGAVAVVLGAALAFRNADSTPTGVPWRTLFVFSARTDRASLTDPRFHALHETVGTAPALAEASHTLAAVFALYRIAYTHAVDAHVVATLPGSDGRMSNRGAVLWSLHT